MKTRTQQALLDHPVFDPIRHHEHLTLAVTSDPFPPTFNPHHTDGVEYRAVSLATGTTNANGKRMMALYAFYDGIERGLITPDTIVDELSSGNTGPEMQKVAMQIGIRFNLFLRPTMPPPKLERARALRGGVVDVQFGDAARVREMGKLPGHYNPDQYRGGKGWNAHAQEVFLAPQVFEGNENAAAIFVVGGSWGTAFGLQRYATEYALRTKVVPVVAAGRDDISGGKNLEQTKNDILDDVFATFPEESIMQVPRDQATLLSWLSWPYVVRYDRALHFLFGQSFGANVGAAFAWVETHKRAGTLKRFENSKGKVVILLIGMDDFQGYTNIYLSELRDDVLNGPRVLPPLEELLQFGRGS
jgi:cysteine synthase